MTHSLWISFIAIFTILEINVASSKFVDYKIVELPNDIKKKFEHKNELPDQSINTDTDKYKIVIIKKKDKKIDAVFYDNSEVFLNYLQDVGRRNGRTKKVETKKVVTKKLTTTKKPTLRERKHARKVKEIADFLKDYPSITDYVEEEITRILKSRVIKDDLRLMLDYFDGHRDKEIVKRKLLECFERLKKKYNKSPGVDMWGVHKPNQWIIDRFEDPYAKLGM